MNKYPGMVFLFGIFFLVFFLESNATQPVSYQEILQSQSHWLEKVQLDSGAIPMTLQATDSTGELKIVPYFANLAAMGMLGTKGNQARVRHYMDWYFKHLNEKDIDGLKGTVYDYQWNPQTHKETSTQNYDSVDSYGATFLSLLRVYYEKTGDKKYLLRHQAQIEEIAGSILSVTHQDMTWAKASYKVKYLMDNCEVWKGWEDTAWLFEKVFNDKTKTAFYRQKATHLKKTLELSLWNREKQVYAPGMFESGEKLSFDWKNFYPDAASQLYPIWTGLILPESPRAKHLYETFCQHYPQWDSLQKPDPFPWAVIAYTAAIMGDTQRAANFLQNTHQKYGLPNYPWPWYCMEAGMSSLAAGKILQNSDGH